MNILYLTVTGNFVGGAERSFYQLLENLDRDKFKPYVVMPDEGELTQKLAQLNIPCIIIPFKKVKNPFHLKYSYKTLRQLIEIICTHKIDIIHSNTQTGRIAFLGGVAAKITRTPFIWHPRITSSGKIWDVIQVLFCTKIIVISKASKRRFWWLLNKQKLSVIYNGINAVRFGADTDRMSFRREVKCQDDEVLIGTVGRFFPHKGFEYFIKAIPHIVEEAPHSKFVLVGFEDPNSDYLCYLKKLVQRYTLEDKVTFISKRSDINTVFSSLDIFIFPSPDEPFGRVLIEAMACQKPVVGFRGGATQEIVEDNKTGYLVNVKDFNAMADKTKYLIKNRDIAEEFGVNGRKRIEKVFDIKFHVQKIENLYRELMKKDGN